MEDSEPEVGGDDYMYVCCKLRTGGCPFVSKYHAFRPTEFCWVGGPKGLPSLGDYQVFDPRTTNAYKGGTRSRPK